ncbi:hypothetical protein [Alicyclobacillus fodiniaquatilis]|uniref:Flagellar operon protein n=1 Tax=Alicyclobacillus fodiniaquatilis TaxID=1661150 RepID=A0ABW4JFC7_9BACL
MSEITNQLNTNWRPFPSSAASSAAKPADANQPSFRDALSAVTQPQTAPWHISQHAQQRLAQRGIQLSTTDLEAMHQAATQAQQKGAKNAYMILGQSGLVVNLPSRTVVTAMDNQANTVVTQIDSVVFVK